MADDLSLEALDRELAGQRFIALPKPDVPAFRIAASLSLFDEREAIALVIADLARALSGHRKALASTGNVLDDADQSQQLRLDR